jgi:hypothetical protein
MTAGIYKLTFSDGSIYVGKSVNIDKRWKQHAKAFVAGTHTKSMQQAYNKYGEPVYTIIIYCHPDHIDILENYYIGCYWGNEKILNSTAPIWYNDADLEVIEEYPMEYWKISTFDHLRSLASLEARNGLLESKLQRSKKAQTISELEAKITELKRDNAALRNRSFLERLFNL